MNAYFKMEPTLTQQIINITWASILFFIGTPANTFLLFTFGRRVVDKDNTVILLLALAAADLIPCFVTSPFEVVTSLLVLISNPNSNSTIPPCQLIFSKQKCALYRGVCIMTEIFPLLLNNLLAINCCYITGGPNRSVWSTHMRNCIIAFIFVFFIFSVSMGIVGAIAISEEAPMKENFLGLLMMSIVAVSVVCTLINILVLNSITLRNIIKQQQQSKKFALELQNKMKRWQSQDSVIDQEQGAEVIQPEQQTSPVQKSQIQRKTQIQVIKRLIGTSLTFIFSVVSVILWYAPAMLSISEPELHNDRYTAYIFLVVFRDIWRFNHIVNAFLFGFKSTKFKREFNKMETRKNLSEYLKRTRCYKRKNSESAQVVGIHMDDNFSTLNGVVNICHDPILADRTIPAAENEAEIKINETVLHNMPTNLRQSHFSLLSSHSRDRGLLTNNTCITTADVHAVNIHHDPTLDHCNSGTATNGNEDEIEINEAVSQNISTNLKADTCNQVKSCTKYGRPDQSQQ